ncbi:MAG: thioredoxin family protein [Prevotellaceae bacterium]|nr:thioredoxin family protein [Candidatus Faecinaster equi]
MRATKWIFCTLIVATLSLNLSAQNAYQNVTEYLNSIVFNPTDSIINKVCELIENIDSPQNQSTVAGIAFDFFSQSNIMGQEAVAVYIADNYFLNKRLKWSDEETYPLLFTFAEFNRQSLIGMDAPDLEISDINGNMTDIRRDNSDYKILYFYDVQCSSCAKQTPELLNLLNKYEGSRVTLFAIYTQSNKDEWAEYVSKNFARIDNENVNVVNLWDPEVESDFQRKYSVLTTPSMLLLDRNNTIIGRRLDAGSLGELLNIQNTTQSGYRELFEQIFSEFDMKDTAIVNQVAGTFFRRVGNDPILFRETFLEMFKFLKERSSEAAVMIAQKYFIGHKEYWSEEILDEIESALYLSSLNPVGQKASNLILADSKGRMHSIDKIRAKYTLLFFHLITCEDCAKELSILEKNKKILRKSGVKVVSIYVGNDSELWKTFCNSNRKWLYLNDFYQSDLHLKYDISIVPKLFLLDKDKNVIAKNISASELIKYISE